MMLRWLLNLFKHSHSWEVVSHRHDVEHNGETFDCYRLEECRCGTIREGSIKRVEVETLLPGLRLAFAEVSMKRLDSLEESMLWEQP